MQRTIWIAPILLIAGATAIGAAPSDVIRNRIAAYRTLGAAFKVANDTVRARDFQSARLRKAAQQIVLASRNQRAWFPAGSGPRSNTRTAAKPEIWTRPGEFRVAQHAFARQASAFQKAVATGNGAIIRSEVRKLGAKCKACHDVFRQSDD